MTQLQLFQEPTQLTQILHLLKEQTRLKDAVYAQNTISGYAYAWKNFEAWCKRMEQNCLPATPQTVSFYIADSLQNKLKITTVNHRCSAIRHYHRAANFPNPITPEVHALLHGAQRVLGENYRQMRPLSIAEIRKMCVAMCADEAVQAVTAVRNRSILTLGLASALRRASIAALQLADVEFLDEGIVLKITREKQDQQGRGRIVTIPLGKHRDICPVRCLRAWLKHRGKAAGALYTRLDNPKEKNKGISGEVVYKVTKLAAARIGDASEIGAHSLRAGFVSEAVHAGVNEFRIAEHTGHRSLANLRRYWRFMPRRDGFRNHPCAAIGF